MAVRGRFVTLKPTSNRLQRKTDCLSNDEMALQNDWVEDLVGPNSPSLNLFTGHVGSDEALSNEIASISQGMPLGRKALNALGGSSSPASP